MRGARQVGKTTVVNNKYYYVLTDDLLYNMRDFKTIGKICDMD